MCFKEQVASSDKVVTVTRVEQNLVLKCIFYLRQVVNAIILKTISEELNIQINIQILFLKTKYLIQELLDII